MGLGPSRFRPLQDQGNRSRWRTTDRNASALSRARSGEDDLEDAALPFPHLGGQLGRFLELGGDSLDDAPEVALLQRREMVEVGFQDVRILSD